MTHKPHPGRVALVTGAARGIGAATAIALAQRGIAPVLLVRDALAASATKQAVTALGVTCGVLQADVADAAQVQQALAQLLDIARLHGLPCAELTTDPDNIASQKVITNNGGVLVEAFDKGPTYGNKPGLRFRIDL